MQVLLEVQSCLMIIPKKAYSWKWLIAAFFCELLAEGGGCKFSSDIYSPFLSANYQHTVSPNKVVTTICASIYSLITFTENLLDIRSPNFFLKMGPLMIWIQINSVILWFWSTPSLKMIKRLTYHTNNEYWQCV